MDAIKALTEVHRSMNRAFLQYEDLSSGATADRREIVDEIIRRLARHTATEQEFLHPLIQATVPDGEGWIVNEVGGHRHVVTMLHYLATSSTESDGFDAQVRELILHVRRHMECEEQSLFPLLRNVVDREHLAQVGDAIRQARAAERRSLMQ
jgi:hemerythrin-like domain-containing protein